MELKSQDTLLALKYWSLRKSGQASSVRAIAEAIGISAGEVSKSTRRLVASRLVVERDGSVFAESGALLEWLCYGVRYVYPQQSTGYGRGMPTAWNCPILTSDMMPPDPPLVWQQAGGAVEGILMQPFHDAVPYAAAQDELLYCALSLIEAVRVGKPRELAIARNLLKELIKNGH
jgi:hypothetical protein